LSIDQMPKQLEFNINHDSFGLKAKQEKGKG
jgi:hypothetical protein